jgi:hypothetical protein
MPDIWPLWDHITCQISGLYETRDLWLPLRLHARCLASWDHIPCQISGLYETRGLWLPLRLHARCLASIWDHLSFNNSKVTRHIYGLYEADLVITFRLRARYLASMRSVTRVRGRFTFPYILSSRTRLSPSMCSKTSAADSSETGYRVHVCVFDPNPHSLSWSRPRTQKRYIQWKNLKI